MGLTKLLLKEDHIKLLKNLRWTFSENKFLVSVDDLDDSPSLFFTDNVYEGIDLILNGKPADFDPFNTVYTKDYTLEQKTEWDKLLSELPTALEIILYNGHFETGTYIINISDRVWERKNKSHAL